MLQTSQDLFYVVLAFCVLWFTVFLCWALYYLIKVLKQTNQIMLEVRTKIKIATDFFSGLKVQLVEKGISRLVNYFKSKYQKNKTKKGKTKTKKQ